MADLTDVQAAQSVKLVGAATADGTEQTPVQSTAAGSIHANLRDNSGTELGTTSNPVTTTSLSNGPVSPGTIATKSNLIGGQYKTTLPVLTDGQQSAIQVDSNGRILVASAVVSSLPAASFSSLTSIASGSTSYDVFTASQNLAIKQFYACGTGIGKQTLYSYVAATTQLVPFGDFESSGDVSHWIYTTNGGTGVLAFSTVQEFTGSGSMSLAFTSSDSNHLNGAKQTFSSAQDFSGWRYITAEFYNVVSAGGAYTRSISIILTDSGGSTRTYLVSGTSTTSPFNASGWIQILGEIANPTSSTGLAFDTSSIVSLELRQFDSANKTATVYWDTVRLQGALTTIFPIYHIGNSSFSINVDPVVVVNNGSQLLIAQTNNDSTRQEYFALAGGVAL